MEAPDQPHLRQSRFIEGVAGNVERWAWDPPTKAWSMDCSMPAAEWERRSRNIIDRRPITEEDQRHAAELARERGWIT